LSLCDILARAPSMAIQDIQVDSLVIGAGPAGSAAAIQLAKAGLSVALVDRLAFPRDKVCGDALIPDALRALDELCLKDRVLEKARFLEKIRVYAPNERFIVIPGDCACVPRETLDDIIRREAVYRGAQFYAGFNLHAALRADGAVQGAIFVGQQGQTLTVRARVTLLATGAAAEPLKRFSVCERVSPSAIAARIYVKADEQFARHCDYLCISFSRTIGRGYGWIFPGPENVFNVGVGYYYDARSKPPETNVRTLLGEFLSACPPAIELIQRSRPLTCLKGAPLRTALGGSRLAAPGLLVIGEAAGMTYSFSGEGIGKAMESGILAADVILNSLRNTQTTVAETARDYSARIRELFTERFSAYKIAQDWLSSPTIANFLAWKANRSPFVQRQLEGLFQETVDPRQLFSLTGVMRSLIS